MRCPVRSRLSLCGVVIVVIILQSTSFDGKYLVLAYAKPLHATRHSHTTMLDATGVSALKINPKPCSNAIGEHGTCMFVWECIKTEGKHLGTCVDGFLFGSCCGHNETSNDIELNKPSTSSTFTPSPWSSHHTSPAHTWSTGSSSSLSSTFSSQHTPPSSSKPTTKPSYTSKPSLPPSTPPPTKAPSTSTTTTKSPATPQQPQNTSPHKPPQWQPSAASPVVHGMCSKTFIGIQ